MELTIKYSEVKNLAYSLKVKTNALHHLQPYNANLMDVLGANENAHSAILVKILKFKCNGVNEFLPSFISRVLKRDLLFNNEYLNISAEKYRIDAFIRDEKNAIIIENKIHGAADQKEQLKRYIDIAKHLGFSANNIYVLYLTGVDSEYELSKSLAEYSESFMGRIQVSSFSTDVLAWLENDVIPNIRDKDKNLLFFVSQYIDHIKGLYFKRDKDKNMNEKLTEYLIESMGLKSESLERTISVMEEEYNVVNGLQKRLASLIIEKKEKAFDYWFEKLKIDFPHLSVLRNIDDSTLTKVGVVFYSDKGNFSVLIEKNNDSLYFGIGRHFTKDTILNEKIKSFSDVFLDKSFKLSPWWYGWKFTNYETGYHELSVLIQKTQTVL